MKDNKFIRNALIAAPIIMSLILLDLGLKKIFFENPGGVVQYDFKLVGIRSLAHYNSTFFSNINIEVDSWVHNVTGYVIYLLLSVWLLFSKDKFRVVSISILIGGVLGNTIDRSVYGYVRDIIFIPWHDKGTFNLSDCIIIIGVSLLVISLLIEILSSKKSSTKKVKK